MSLALRQPAFARARARAGARCVAGLAIVFQLVAWLHAAGAPHVTCAEHGDGVHLAVPEVPQVSEAARAADLRAADPRAADPIFATTIAAESAGAGADAHDHCRLQHQGRTQTHDPDRSFVPVDARAPVALEARAVPVRAPILSFAPKTSPPA